MGKTLQIKGEPEHYPREMTIRELKEEMEVPLNDVVRYETEDGVFTLSDRDTVADIPDGAPVTTMSTDDALFG